MGEEEFKILFYLSFHIIWNGFKTDEVHATGLPFVITYIQCNIFFPF